MIEGLFFLVSLKKIHWTRGDQDLAMVLIVRGTLRTFCWSQQVSFRCCKCATVLLLEGYFF